MGDSSSSDEEMVAEIYKLEIRLAISKTVQRRGYCKKVEISRKATVEKLSRKRIHEQSTSVQIQTYASKCEMTMTRPPIPTTSRTAQESSDDEDYDLPKREWAQLERKRDFPDNNSVIMPEQESPEKAERQIELEDDTQINIGPEEELTIKIDPEKEAQIEGELNIKKEEKVPYSSAQIKKRRNAFD